MNMWSVYIYISLHISYFTDHFSYAKESLNESVEQVHVCSVGILLWGWKHKKSNRNIVHRYSNASSPYSMHIEIPSKYPMNWCFDGYCYYNEYVLVRSMLLQDTNGAKRASLDLIQLINFTFA